MEIVEIVENARGGWSLRLANGQTVGNYGTRADALRVARWNGHTDAKKDALSK